MSGVTCSVKIRKGKPPATTAQGFCLEVSLRYTERHFMHQIHLTEPQGIIKNLQQRRRVLLGGFPQIYRKECQSLNLCD